MQSSAKNVAVIDVDPHGDGKAATEKLMTTVGSPTTSNNKISDDLEQLTNTQSNDVGTITLSSPDKLIEIDRQEFPSTAKTEEK